MIKSCTKTAIEHGISVRPPKQDKDGEYEKFKYFSLGDSGYTDALDNSAEKYMIFTVCIIILSTLIL